MLCLAAVNAGVISLYFASLPGWFVAAALYLGFSFVQQRRYRPAAGGL